MPTTRSRRRNFVRPVAHLASAGPENQRAADVQMQAARANLADGDLTWAIRRGSRPASSFDLQLVPEPAIGWTATGPLAAGRPSGRSGIAFTPTSGATTATSGSRASAR
jgi:hypothetical protein